MFELSPSGSVMVTEHLLPLVIGEHVGGGSSGLGIDLLRLVLILYILFFQAVTEASAKVAVGMSGLNYIFSFVGFLDASTVALFIGIMHMRLKHDPPDPTGMTQFYSYSFDATVHERLFATEGLFLLFLCIRFCTLMKLSPMIEQYWKMVDRAAVMIGYWLFIFFPLFLSAIVIAHCIWSARVFAFSTLWEATISLIFLVKQDFNLVAFYEASPGWTLPFLIYFIVLMTLFLMNGFLAITVHAYYQVQLTDMLPREAKPWSRDQWMDWILAGPIYRCIFQKAPGASKREDGGDGEEGEEGDEDEDDDDEKDD